MPKWKRQYTRIQDGTRIEKRSLFEDDRLETESLGVGANFAGDAAPGMFTANDDERLFNRAVLLFFLVHRPKKLATSLIPWVRCEANTLAGNARLSHMAHELANGK